MKVMKWIELGDRLPRNDVYVLVSLWDVDSLCPLDDIAIMKRRNKKWFYDRSEEEQNIKYKKVTHWMPLPDDPKREKNEDAYICKRTQP